MHCRFVRNPDVCLDRVIKQRLAILGKLAKLGFQWLADGGNVAQSVRCAAEMPKGNRSG
jgi:hypothetical protein